MSVLIKKRTFGRRSLLRGLVGGAAVSVALPVLELAMNDSGTAFADGSGFPRRYMTWFWGNGVHPVGWTPDNPANLALTDPAFPWTDLWTPLRGLAPKMTALTGFDVKTPGQFPHDSGIAGILSGAPLADERVWLRPTIDQIIADETAGSTLYRSLHLAGTDHTKAIAHRGPNDRIPSEPSPLRVYEQLFTDGFRLPGEGGVIDPRMGLRRSVLDAVADDNRRLQARLGRADRLRLEQHFTAIREIELRLRRLQEDPPNYASCARPEMPPSELPPDERGRPDVDEHNRLMAELSAMAFACDQTRIITYMLSPPVSDIVFPVGDLDVIDDGNRLLKGHHDLTHNEPDPTMPKVREIVVYIMERLATYMEILDSVPEGDGTLLDHSLVLATTDSSNPRLHSLEDFPVLLFGGADGKLAMNRHVQGNSDNAAKVLMSVARAMGVNRSSIGKDAGEVSDGIAEIEL